MSKTTYLLALILMMSYSIHSQSFFDKQKLIETGVYYYPEAWDSAQWDRDFKKMHELGFEFTHMAEFAWAMLEPEEGKYNFNWLDKAVSLASKNGLKVIICTPTATPPSWLTVKYPEIFVIKDNGEKASHGTREQYSWSSKKYQELTVKIVTQMANHYGNDKRIWGWQIDNEPSHYGIIDYGPEVRLSFIEWLKKKYKTIDNLNKAWGLAFWSGVYNNFEQIELPNPSRMICGVASPHAILDFKRFNADECASYISLQNTILRKYISKNQFVTTNFMHFHSDVDPWRNNDLDFISYTMYPVAGYTNGLGDQGFRLGDWWRISFANDFYRPLNGTTGVMELQPGQVNWGAYNPLPYPGTTRAWLWNCYAGGLKFASTYRFRQPLFGGEQYHYGIVNTDGVTPSPGGREYSQFMKEIRDLRKIYNPSAKIPVEYANRKTAFLFNFDNLWNSEFQKQTYQWSFEKHMMKYYSILKSFCAPVDFISEDVDFSKYKILVAPSYQLVDKSLIDKFSKYVENGGNLVLTCRTGQKDKNGHLYEMKWAGMISDLIGGDILMYDVLPNDKFAVVETNSINYKWNIWGDIIEAKANTEVWAKYSDQFYAGKASVIHRKLGKGSVTYIGTDSNDGKLEHDMLKKLFQNQSITIKELPEGVSMQWNDGFWIAINYSSQDVLIDIPAKAKIIIGNANLKPAEVVVWVE